MYVKIVSLDQLNKLKEGDIVIKHPTDGNKAENFYSAEITNSIFMTISDRNGDVFELVENPGQQGKASAGELIIAPLHLKAADLIEEGVWWIEL
jgi:hypothetical protein